MPTNKNIQIVANLANQISNIAKDPKTAFEDLNNLRKILMECAVGDSYAVDDVLGDIKDAIEDGMDFSKIATDPNKLICYPIVLYGLGVWGANLAEEVATELYSYYKGFMPFMKDILKSLQGEVNLELIGTAFLKAQEERLAQLMDMGISFVQSKVSKELKKYTDKVYNAVGVVGRYMAFLMVISKEFRYIMYLTFLKNLESQTKERINKLIKLRNGINKLAWEIDQGNSSTNTDLFYGPLLNNYIGALKLLDNSTFLAEKIKRDIITKDVFNSSANDNMKKNFELAENLLTKQTNSFLEKFLAKDEYQVEDNASYQYYFPEEFSNFTAKTFTYFNNNETKYIQKENEFKLSNELQSLDSLFFTTKLEKNLKVFLDIPQEELLVDTPDEFWIRVEYHYFSKGDYILIGDDAKNNVFIVRDYKNITKPDDAVNNNIKEKIYQFLLIQQKKEQFDGKISKEKLKNLQIRGLQIINSSNYTLLSKQLIFEVSDDNFKIIEKDLFNNPLNCLVLNNNAKTQITNIWQDSKDFNFLMFLESKHETIKKIKLLLAATYPNFVEQQEKKEKEILDELPEPFKNMYNAYDELRTTKVSKMNIGDIKKNMGYVSEMLFGKNLLGDLDSAFGVNNYSYTEYLKSATELLKLFCPLKNSILTYYGYVDSLESLEDTTESMATKMAKDWTLFIDVTIEETLKSMTKLAANGNYETIEEIKSSPVYYKLLPALLTDYDNIINLKTLANLQGEVGRSINVNNQLDSKFQKLQDLINWLKSGYSNELKNAELEMWSQLSATLTSTVGLILRGERVSTVKPVLDAINKKIVNLTYKLNLFLKKIQDFSGDNFSSQTEFVKLLDDMGLDHWVDMIQAGQIANFMSTDFAGWVGKYSKAIDCLSKLMPQFSGMDKKIMAKILAHLKSLDFGELATNWAMGLFDLGTSINVNLITGLIKSPKGNLKNTIDRATLAKNGVKIINETFKKG